MKMEYQRKQYGHKDYFFKLDHNRVLQRWLKDLNWRCKASEAQVKERFAPSTVVLPRRKMDETESAVHRAPERVLGLVVRYEPKPKVNVMDDVVDEVAAQAQRDAARKKKQKKKAATMNDKATFSMMNR